MPDRQPRRPSPRHHFEPASPSDFDEGAAAREQARGGIASEVGELHRLLVESVQDYAIFALDPAGYILSWNAGAERFKGYTSDEIIGKHFSIFYPEEKVASGWPEHELKEAARVGRFEDEGWRIRKDGSRFWANVVITALRDSSGQLLGFAKVTRDLTERRAAEERAIEDARRVAAEEAARNAADVARKRTEQLQLLTSALASVHTIPEIVRIVFSDGFAAMGVDAGALGVIDAAGERVEILAETGYETVRGGYRSIPIDADIPMTVTISSAGPVVCRSRAERDRRFPATAELLAPFEVSVVLPLVSRGRPMGALAMHRRAGERADEPLTSDTLAFMQSFAQQCGQALERARLYEAERQARQAAEEARARAEEARARAEEANRAKSEFLAAMSHELRTPLNAIGGYAQLMELGIGGEVSDAQRDQLSRIRRSQQHLLGIINDILNFSRIDAGQITYNLGSVPLQEVVDAVRHMVEPQAIAKGLVLEAPQCSPDLRAWADRAKVEQIVLNLLSNAVKFTAPGGRVGIACDHAADRQVQLTVRDTGSGIPPDQREQIFEPFVQVGRSLTASQEGTGLGLAISRDLARAMRGDIRVESTVDVGSTFTLTLPRDEGSAKDD